MQWRHLTTALAITTIAATGLMTACATDYELRFNERVVYTPLPLFNDFETADPALQDCIVQTIEDQRVVRVDDLKVLNCSHAGISSLTGLSIFRAIESLKLAENQLTDIDELAGLEALQAIDLSGNSLTSTAALASLPRLLKVDLHANPSLDCSIARNLAERSKLAITFPQHCSEN